jgi:hypothetical protein
MSLAMVMQRSVVSVLVVDHTVWSPAATLEAIEGRTGDARGARKVMEGVLVVMALWAGVRRLDTLVANSRWHS